MKVQAAEKIESEFSKKFYMCYLFVFVELLCSHIPKMTLKIKKNVVRFLLIVIGWMVLV